MANQLGWIAVQPHIVGNLERYEICYSWDGTVHLSRQGAIRHGLREFGSDDFNIGRVSRDRLVWWGWMDEEIDREDLPMIAAALGLQPPDEDSAHV